MKTLKFTESQFIFVIKLSQMGVKTVEICHKMGISQATFFNWKKKFGGLRLRITKIAKTLIRYGFWRIFVLLKREGFRDDHKRVYRIYKEDELNLRTK